MTKGLSVVTTLRLMKEPLGPQWLRVKDYEWLVSQPTILWKARWDSLDLCLWRSD